MKDEHIKQVRRDCKKAYEYFVNNLAFTLGPVELKHFMDKGGIRVVDVRAKEDYDAGHIPGAISIPKAEIADNLDKLSKEEITIVYCYNQQCHLGANACIILADFEYPVMLLEGGYKVWTEDFRFAVQQN
ncbi:rhodanese-like domain-containing protein [bacterium]|nr:rhodanese-like domain-containing protein [bacterium]